MNKIVKKYIQEERTNRIISNEIQEKKHLTGYTELERGLDAHISLHRNRRILQRERLQGESEY